MFDKLFKKLTSPKPSEFPESSTPEMTRTPRQETLSQIRYTLERYQHVQFPIDQHVPERQTLRDEILFYIQRNNFIPLEQVQELLVSKDSFFTIAQMCPHWPRYVQPNALARILTNDLLARMYLYNPNGLQLLTTTAWQFNDICSMYHAHTDIVDPQVSFVSAQYNPQLDQQQEKRYPTRPEVKVRTYPEVECTRKMKDVEVTTLEFMMLNAANFPEKLNNLSFDLKGFFNKPTPPYLELEEIIPKTEIYVPSISSKSKIIHSEQEADTTQGGSKSKNKSEMIYLKRGQTGFILPTVHSEPLHVIIVDVGQVTITLEAYNPIPSDMQKVIKGFYPELLDDYPDLFQETGRMAANLLTSYGFDNLASEIQTESRTFIVPLDDMMFRFTDDPQAIHTPVFINPLYFKCHPENVLDLQPLKSFKEFK